jgi:hypothetical protein
MDLDLLPSWFVLKSRLRLLGHSKNAEKTIETIILIGVGDKERAPGLEVRRRWWSESLGLILRGSRSGAPKRRLAMRLKMAIMPRTVSP